LFVSENPDTLFFSMILMTRRKKANVWAMFKTQAGQNRVGKESRTRKIALGNPMHDIVETLFLTMFYGGKMKAMPPKLLTGKKYRERLLKRWFMHGKKIFETGS